MRNERVGSALGWSVAMGNPSSGVVRSCRRVLSWVARNGARPPAGRRARRRTEGGRGGVGGRDDRGHGAGRRGGPTDVAAGRRPRAAEGRTYGRRAPRITSWQYVAIVGTVRQWISEVSWLRWEDRWQRRGFPGFRAVRRGREGPRDDARRPSSGSTRVPATHGSRRGGVLLCGATAVGGRPTAGHFVGVASGAGSLRAAGTNSNQPTTEASAKRRIDLHRPSRSPSRPPRKAPTGRVP